ncbi:PAC2 family protein [Humibacter albus]|uniref:PAC2 family protein n=1 Tax=Humibacter albus TaxID=427754 RepID=UPI0003B636AD|nr:PAC2 family protein [Humibacter albus]
MTNESGIFDGHILVVAFEGWNDAGEAASGAVRTLKDALDVVPVAGVDPELYYDFQFNRPTIASDDEGQRRLEWPGAVLYAPVSPGIQVDPLEEDAEFHASGAGVGNLHLLLGTEPSRSWKAFTTELIDAALSAGIDGVVLLGSMLADVPHTRPISVFTSSENPQVRTDLGVERPTYEGPVGILSVFADAAETVGIPTLTLWASVPHYVHNSPSPKAMLALIEKLEQMLDVTIPRGDLVADSAAWESGIDALAADDEDMAAYIEQLEQARDTVDSPEASGEAIAQEFERYLRRRGDGRGDKGDGRGDSRGPDEPWRRD